MSRLISDPSPMAYENLLASNTIEANAVEAELVNTKEAILRQQEQNRQLEKKAAEIEKKYNAQLTRYETAQNELLQTNEAIQFLHTDRHNRLFELESEYREKSGMLENQLEKLRYQYANAIKGSSSAADERDMALEAYTAAKEYAAGIKAEQDDICNKLENELAEANEQFTAVIGEAAAKYSQSTVALHSAEKTLEKASALAPGTVEPLAYCDKAIEDLTRELEQLRNDQEKNAKELRMRGKQAINESNITRDTAYKDYVENARQAEESLALAQTAQKAYKDTKEKLANLSVRLQALFSVSEQNTFGVTNNMEQAIQAVAASRIAYNDAATFVTAAENNLSAVSVTAARLRLELDSKQALLGELNAASAIAQQLSEDADAEDLANIDELGEDMEYIRASLTGSADETQSEYEAEAALVELLQQAYQIQSEEIQQWEDTCAVAKAACSLREEECKQADDELQRITVSTTQWVKDREEMANKISSVKNEYDTISQELVTLRGNAERTMSSYYNAKARADQARWVYSKHAMAAEDAVLEWNKRINEQEEQDIVALHDIQSMLAIAKDKRSKLAQIHDDAVRLLKDAQTELERNTSVLTDEEANYTQIKADSERSLAELHERIKAAIDNGKELVLEAEAQAEQAAAAYEKALVNASATDDSTAYIKAAITEAENQFIPLKLEIRTATQTIEDNYQQQFDKLQKQLAKDSTAAQQAAETLAIGSAQRQQILAEKEHGIESLKNLRHYNSTLEKQKMRLARERRHAEEEYRQYSREQEAKAKEEEKAAIKRREEYAKEAQQQKEALRSKIQQDMALAQERMHQEQLKLAEEITAAQGQMVKDALDILAGKFLHDHKDLAMAPDDAIQDCIEQMKETVRKEVEDLDISGYDTAAADREMQEARTYAHVAKTEEEIFRNAKETYINIQKQFTDEQEERKNIIRQQLGTQGRIDTLQSRINDMQLALDKLLANIAQDDQQALHHASSSIKDTLDEDKNQLKLLQLQFSEESHALSAADENLQRMQNTLDSTAQLMSSSMNKWIYNENLAFRQRYLSEKITQNIQAALPAKEDMVKEEPPRENKKDKEPAPKERNFFKRKKFF